VTDLHLHTTASDGRSTPEELVAAVAAAGVRVMAVTDHDTVAAVADVAALASARGMTTLTGIEITAVEEGRDVHVLAYGFRADDPALLTFLTAQLAARRERTVRIGARLAELGAPVDIDAVMASVPTGRSVGRPHIARALVAAGHVRSVAEAFDRWLSGGCPAFVAREGASVASVVGVVSGAGGVASLAHPGKAGVDARLRAFVDAGLPAIEVFHPDHPPALRERYREFAESHGLLMTGGSDYHGEPEQHRTPGCARVPDEVWAALSARLG